MKYFYRCQEVDSEVMLGSQAHFPLKKLKREELKAPVAGGWADSGVLTCWVAAAPWHGPAAQRLWMPLLEAPVPLPRRERDPGKMHPKDTQKNINTCTYWVVSIWNKTLLAIYVCSLAAFQYASWVLFRDSKNTLNPGVSATGGSKCRRNVSPIYSYEKERAFYLHGAVRVGDWGKVNTIWSKRVMPEYSGVIYCPILTHLTHWYWCSCGYQPISKKIMSILTDWLINASQAIGETFLVY